jgi:TatD DNase family protein
MLVDSPKLVDSHCHLDYLEDDEALEAVVARAEAAGVGTLVTICTRLSEFDRVRAIAGRFERVYCSAGVHPHEAGEEGQDDPARLVELAADVKVIGIGETGLDYYYDNSPREAQRASFRTHIAAARETGLPLIVHSRIAAARETGLPLIVHSRDADADTVKILEGEAGEGGFPGVIHCFTAGRALAEAALELGLYISLSGVITFKNADELRAIAKDLPLERILVETDAPYLAPVPKRGKRNEPAYVVHTAAFVAELLGLPADELARITSENFFRLFAKAAPATEP